MTRVVSNLEDLQRIAPEWRALLRGAAGASIFQTPEWCLAWWTAFGSGALHVVVSRRAGQLEAVAPLYLRPGSGGRPSSLVLLGTGNSDRLDVIATSRGAAVAVVRTASDLAEIYRWRIDWRRLPRISPLLWACKAGSVVDDVPCPVLTLPRAQASLEEAISPQLRSRVEYGRRRLEREGTLRCEWLAGSKVQQGLTELFDLHAHRWRRKGDTGVLADPAVQEFHRDVAARFDALGELRLVRLRVGERVAAIYYGFQAFHRAWFYLAGFDPSLSAASPGSVLLAEVLSASISDRVDTFDFLAGQEPYKYEWGAVDRPYFCRTLEPHAQALPA